MTARIEVRTLGDPNCPDCHGSGYAGGGHVKDHKGRNVACFRYCPCIDARRETADERAQAELIAALKHAGLADPRAAAARDIWWGMDGRDEMERAVRAFIEHIVSGQAGGALVLAGPLGIGKTALAEWAVVECVKAGRRALYVSSLLLAEAVQARINHDERGGEYLHRVRNAELVAFDQIDWAEKASPMTQEAVRDIFDQRYQQRRTKATIYLVNLTSWDGEKSGVLAPIYNRMLEAEVCRAAIKGVRAALGQTFAEKVT